MKQVQSIAAALSSTTCAVNLMKLACALVYRPCNHSSAPDFLPPTEVCTALDACPAGDAGIINSWFPDTFHSDIRNCVPESLSFVVYSNSTRSILPRCRNFTSSVCGNLVDYPVYESPDKSLEETEAELRRAQVVFRATNKFSCLEPISKLVCALAFQPCVTPGSVIDLPIPFPRLPHRDLCEAAHKSCNGPLFIDRPGCDKTDTSTCALGNLLSFADCNQQIILSRQCHPVTGDIAPLTTTALFSDSATTFSAGVGVTEPNEMNNTKYENFVAEFDAGSCPAPLVKPDNPNFYFATTNGSSCAPPCPSLLYTKQEYRDIDKLMLIGSWAGLLLCCVTLATYAAFKKTRKNIFSIQFSFAICMVSLSLAFSAFVTSEGTPNVDTAFAHVRCDDNTTPSMGGYCLFQAIMFTMFGIAGANLWFVQALDLYLQISFNARRWSLENKRIKTICYYIWGWGYPLIATIACLSVDKLGNSNVGIAWCFITDSDLAWGVFYSVVGVQAVLGTLFMFLIIIAIYRSSVAAGTKRKPGWWKIYFRPMVFVAAFLLCWGLVFAYRGSEQLNQDQYKEDGTEFVGCLLRGGSYGDSGITNPCNEAVSNTPCYCSTRPHPTRASWYLIHFIIGFVGVVCFFAYNTNENFVMWYHFILCKSYNFSRTNVSTSGNGSRGSRGSSRGNSRGASRQASRKKLHHGTTKSSSSQNIPMTTLVVDQPMLDKA